MNLVHSCKRPCVRPSRYFVFLRNLNPSVKFATHIAETIRGIVDGLPRRMSVEIVSPETIRQLAADIGVPPILVVLAFVNGRKRRLDEPLTEDADIYLMGPIAGG
ncbi:uncharacterized protein Dmul_01610 [Desulfococcus multivorans]|nr:uncharacterized protein Dmul_01610 [Desulfococcus multivorans]